MSRASDDFEKRWDLDSNANIPVEQGFLLVSYSDDLNLGIWWLLRNQGSDGLEDVRMDTAAEATIGGHCYHQVDGLLLIRSDLCLLEES